LGPLLAVSLYRIVARVKRAIARPDPALGQAVGVWLGVKLCLVGSPRTPGDSDAVIDCRYHQHTVVGPQPDDSLEAQAIIQQNHIGFLEDAL
jgi:hypothetical protein